MGAGTTAVGAAGPESRRWQAANWPGNTSRSCGSSTEQRSKADIDRLAEVLGAAIAAERETVHA